MAPLDPDNPLSREPPVVPARPVRELPSQLQAGPTSLPQGKVPPTRPPPAAGPGPQAREWRDTPQRGQIPVGRAPPSWNSQRAPLPPRFEAEIRRHTRFRPQFKDAFDWYREHLTEGDLLFSNTTGLTDIQKILRDDANPHPGVDHHSWRPVKALGSGTYGSVVLWQRATGNCEHPVENVACKDAKFDGFYTDYCHEGHLIRRLNVAGCPNVVKIHEWSPLAGKDQIRMILEYCPMGDLRGLFKFYQKNMLTFPEAFLWHVFQSIATSICYSARGTTDEEPVPGWQEIIHRDLKPANILLSDPTAPHPYPTLKVTDFGMGYSVPTNTDSVRRFKRSYWSAGTHFFAAPEVDDKIRSDRDQAPDDIVSPRSDVYSLGAMMMKFLWLARDRYDRREYRQLDFNEPWAYDYFPYSQPLVSLIRTCVLNDARARPNPLELWKLTTEHAHNAQTYVLTNMEKAWMRMHGIYYGMILTGDQQTTFIENPNYAQLFVRETDWFWSNGHKLQALQATRYCTLALASQAGHVAILSGLQGHVSLDELIATRPDAEQDSYLEKMPVYNEKGHKIMRADGTHFMRYIAPERLRVPEFNRNWRVDKAKLVRERAIEEQTEIRKHIEEQAQIRQRIEERRAKQNPAPLAPMAPEAVAAPDAPARTGLSIAMADIAISGVPPQQAQDINAGDTGALDESSIGERVLNARLARLGGQRGGVLGGGKAGPPPLPLPTTWEGISGGVKGGRVGKGGRVEGSYRGGWRGRG